MTKDRKAPSSRSRQQDLGRPKPNKRNTVRGTPAKAPARSHWNRNKFLNRKPNRTGRRPTAEWKAGRKTEMVASGNEKTFLATWHSISGDRPISYFLYSSRKRRDLQSHLLNCYVQISGLFLTHSRVCLHSADRPWRIVNTSHLWLSKHRHNTKTVRMPQSMSMTFCGENTGTRVQVYRQLD